MAISEKDQAVLRALDAARQKHENLAELLEFYQDLYQIQFAAKDRLPSPELGDEMAIQWRLQSGIPQLAFEKLHIEPHAFAELVTQITMVFAKHHSARDLAEEEHDPYELVALAQDIFETWKTLTGPTTQAESGLEGEPLSLVVAFAQAAYLQHAADQILAELDLAAWVHGYCPVCGGQPNLAVLAEERGARRLLCSRCDALWNYSRVGCPVCRSKEKQTYYLSDDGVYRLYVCPDCGRYLKTVDLREVHGERYPVVERLLTVTMDLAAMEEGIGP